jgi:polysaccharide export outer membrane protein
MFELKNVKVLFYMIGFQLFASCAYMPGMGPDAASVINNAEGASRTETDTLGYNYVLVDITSDTIPFMMKSGIDAGLTFGIDSDVIPEIRLGVGDVIQLTVFESEAGGLFIPREAGVRPGNFVELPRQEIGRNGKITVPYAGELTAAGQTPETLESNVEQRLEALAIEPEVTVTILERNYAQVTVIGAVENSGKYIIGTGGDRILDIIGKAGGVTTDDFSTDVTLTRAGISATVPYELITSNPFENIYVAPGDSLILSSEARKFYIFGASGVGEYAFNSGDADLRKALSIASGLNDGSADPSQVFIYRSENRDVLAAMGFDVASLNIGGGSTVPTIYRADFRQPDSFFMAADFEIRDGDMIYVTNARAVELGKFFDVIRTVTGNSVAIEADVNTLTR